MSFGEVRKIVPPQFSFPQSSPAAPARRPKPWRIERSGDFAEFAVSGWRYQGLAIWHVKLWSKQNDHPQRSYTVAAAEFYPPTVTAQEKFAVLRLIALWEADGLD